MSNYTVTIQHNQEKTELQCLGNEPMSSIITKYKNKSGLEVEKFYFVCNGIKLSENQTLQEISKESTKVEILANPIQVKQKNLNCEKESDYIKCDQCFDPAIIEFLKNYRIVLSDGKHGQNKIKLLDFISTQLVDQSKIICSKCNNSREEIHLNKFYFCFECGKNFCPICQSMHREHKNIVDFSLKNFKCSLHNGQNFTFYCVKCMKNFCTYCTGEHKNHRVLNFGNILPNKKVIEEFVQKVLNVEKDVDDIIEILKKFKDGIDVYVKIVKKLNEKVDEMNVNYEYLESLKNVAEISSIKMDLDEILNTKSINEKIKKILSIYDVMTLENANIVNLNPKIEKKSSNFKTTKIVSSSDSSNKINPGNGGEITLKVKVDEADINNYIYFLDNTCSHSNLNELNESNTTLIIDGAKYPFKKFFKPKKRGIYTIKLIFGNKLTNCANMFYNCGKIFDIDLSNFKTQNVTDMKRMFYECSSLTSINFSSSFNTEKVVNMQYMFFKCKELKSLDLKSFNTNNVTDMSYMFNWCSSLTSLDLSSFKAAKADTEDMFYGCKNLVNCSCLDLNIKKRLNESKAN